MAKTIKVVLSPGWGAGIASWNDYELAEHPDVVRAVERGATMDEISALVEELFPGNHYYLGGFRDAEVVEVTGPYRIEEYDGNESIVTPRNQGPWRNAD